MIIDIKIIVLLVVLLAGIVWFALRVREKNRKSLFYVLLRLAEEEMDTPLPELSIDAVQRRYQNTLSTLQRARKVAKTERELLQCKKAEKDLTDWRVQKVQSIDQNRLNRLLKQIRDEQNIDRKLALLFEARELILEGVLENERLEKIDGLIVHLYVKKARDGSAGLPGKKKYQIYEQIITQILNSGIDDAELNKMKELREFITEFEVLYKQFKKPGKESE
ncbi:MAG: hypothetical protein GXO77_05040 [Calditrichaeota bacterium]|nr:hypothetical protein [Calditrichota bacterium]